MTTNNLTPGSALDFIGGFLLLVLYISPFIAVSWLIIYKWGKRDISNEKQYEKLYKEIHGLINEGEMTLPRKEFIEWKMNELSRLPWKNPEKSKVLKDNFLIAVEKYRKKRIKLEKQIQTI